MPSMLLTSTHFTGHKLAQLLDLSVIWLDVNDHQARGDPAYGHPADR